jgi:phenylacetate-CoA ligase
MNPGGVGHDWWRIGRFLNAVGIGAGDIVRTALGII